MKQMSVDSKIFLDSNLLIYAHTNLDVSKQLVIQGIIKNETTFVSTQVLKEAANVLHKKFKFPWDSIQKILSEIHRNNKLFINDYSSISKACQIAERYGFSFYDSLIISSALKCQC